MDSRATHSLSMIHGFTEVIVIQVLYWYSYYFSIIPRVIIIIPIIIVTLTQELLEFEILKF